MFPLKVIREIGKMLQYMQESTLTSAIGSYIPEFFCQILFLIGKNSDQCSTKAYWADTPSRPKVYRPMCLLVHCIITLAHAGHG